jgi:hypothetical protein
MPQSCWHIYPPSLGADCTITSTIQPSVERSLATRARWLPKAKSVRAHRQSRLVRMKPVAHYAPLCIRRKRCSSRFRRQTGSLPLVQPACFLSNLRTLRSMSFNKPALRLLFPSSNEVGRFLKAPPGPMPDLRGSLYRRHFVVCRSLIRSE